MNKKTKIKCPNCGEETIFPNENALLDYWVDNKGIFHWNCFECNHEWLGDYKGDKLK